MVAFERKNELLNIRALPPMPLGDGVMPTLGEGR